MTEVLFWVSGLMLLYSLVGYPVLLLAVSRLFPVWIPRDDRSPPASATFLVAAYNEAAVIADKLRSTLALDQGGCAIDIVVVCDGSDDGTADAARSVADPRIIVIEPGRQGKAGAIESGLLLCTGDIVVFSDANALLEPQSLAALRQHFTDDRVGGVCGQLAIATRGVGGIGRSEGLYWRYDQAIKLAESRVGGAVSAQGSVYAVRRVLARPPRLGCTDDFDISVGAVHAGYRLVFEPNARTTETTTERVGDEMRRRIRSSERGWRSLMQNAALLNPGLHGLYAWQLISHKLVRRMNPFLLFVFLVTNLALFASATFYTLTGLCQIAFYGVALAGLLRSEWRRHRIVGLASFFAFTHVALALGIMRCLFGRKSISWTPSRAEA